MAGTGLISRLLSASSVTEWTNHPQLNLIAVALYWDDWEPSFNTFVYGGLSETSQTGTIAHAHDHGYQVMFRVFMGRDAPLGGGTNSWMASNYPTGNAGNNFKPVNAIDFLSNESGEMWPTRAAGTLNEKIPDVVTTLSYNNYRYHIQRVLTEIARYLNAPCPKDSTHPIKTHVLAMPCAGPTENGDEFAMNYHRYQPAYAGTATLRDGISTSTNSFVLTGTGSYPAAGGCWRIVDGAEQADGGKTERIDVTSFNSTTRTVTVVKRGHSGDVAKSHLAGCVVQYSPAATTASPQGSELAAYGGYPASGTRPFDVYNTCRKALFDVTSGANSTAKNTALIAAYKQAWIDNINDHMNYLPADVRSIVFGANLFNDNTDSADAVIQQLGPIYTTRLYAGTTNMDVASGAGGFKYQYAQPGGHDFLVKAIAAGCLIGLQLAGKSRLPNLGDAANVTPTKQDIINTIEECIATYGAKWVEMQGSTRMNVTSPLVSTTAVGGWPGGTTDQQSYLLTGADNVNDRFEPVAVPLEITGVGIASTVQFGNGVVAVAKTITGTGIASTVVFGTGLLLVGSEKAVVGNGIASTLVFGTGTIANNPAILGEGIASTLVFGTGLVVNGSVKEISGEGHGIASTLEIGLGAVSLDLDSDPDDDGLQPYSHTAAGGITKTREEMERTGVSIHQR